MGILFYSSYVAFSVRRGLAVGVYRSRALWVGILAIFIGADMGIANVTFYGASPFFWTANFLFYWIILPSVLLVLFILVDRSINTVIRLDFLRRDVAGWKRGGRLIYWAGVAVQFVVYFWAAPLAQLGASYALGYEFAFFSALALYGAAALILGSLRTRDMTFRAHIKWFGVMLLVGITGDFVASFVQSVLVQDVAYVLFSFSLYKATMSLVPASRLSATEALGNAMLGGLMNLLGIQTEPLRRARPWAAAA